MKTHRRILCLLSVLGATLLLSSCKLALLDPKGPIAASEARLLIESTLLMLLVVIPVIVMSWYFAWHYRASNKKATYAPDEHDSTKIEIVCWTIPCIIIAILSYLTWVYSHKLDPYRPLDVPGKTLTIQAVSLEWKWLFIYPNEKIATVNYVNIPVNTKIRFMITSDAPMNSFAIPRLAGQIYAMAGMRTKLHLMGTHVGTYRGLSTNYSGDGFSDMNFKVRVSNRHQYNNWVKKAQRAPKKLTVAEYNKLTQPTTNDPVQYFSAPAKGLFHNVIMKFVMPMPGMDILDDGTKVKLK